jgi:alpha-L-fucosidase 2
MKRFTFIVVIVLLSSAFHLMAQDKNVIWYDSPAKVWEEALPIGNGRLGAMVFGGCKKERIQFNENTLYSGEPDCDANINISEDLKKVRMLLHEGKNDEAEAIILRNWRGRLNEAYQPFGDLYFTFNMKGEIEHYKHTLNMRNGIVTTSYQQNGVNITREVFASYPAQAIVIRLKADAPFLDFSVDLNSLHPYRLTMGDKDISITGQAPAHAQRRTIERLRKFGTEKLHPEYFDKEGQVIRHNQIIYGDELKGQGMFFEGNVEVKYYNGTFSIENHSMKFEACDEVVITLFAATSYNGPNVSPSRAGKDPHKEILRYKKMNSSTNYVVLKEEHVKDFSSLYDRVSLDLPSNENQKRMPTDERIKHFVNQNDAGLVAQLFQFGRYLMISGSRGDGQPLNLQGLWNDKKLPPWNSGYTLNINLEMNYWPAEVTNLSECHRPLFNFLEGMAERGKKIAKEMYGLDGWVMHHNVSIWREKYPSDGFVFWFFWNMSGPWLCTHIWEHYLYTNDLAFLRSYYPILKGAALFFEQWMVKDDNEQWVTPVSTSPENAFYMPNGKKASVCQGATMDMAIIRQLFTITTKVSSLLQQDQELRYRLMDKMKQIKGYTLDKDNRILEWDKPYKEQEVTHRHMSHLFGLFPGNDITVDTPIYYCAARNTLLQRGNKGPGWSRVWKIALWARLHDGEKAHSALSSLVHFVTPHLKNQESGGLCRNCFSGLPFQIDANLGLTAGIAEMLLQSHNNKIELLPALPEKWSSGSVSGLKARGGITVGLTWNKHRLQKVELLSNKDGTINLLYQGKIQKMNLLKGKKKVLFY